MKPRRLCKSVLMNTHMRNGVTMRNPESVYIEDGVEIGNDTEICQNVTIKSGTKSALTALSVREACLTERLYMTALTC